MLLLLGDLSSNLLELLLFFFIFSSSLELSLLLLSLPLESVPIDVGWDLFKSFLPFDDDFVLFVVLRISSLFPSFDGSIQIIIFRYKII